MTTVLADESGENKQDTIIPVPAPVKKSTTDFSCFIVPITLSLSIDCTIVEASLLISVITHPISVHLHLFSNDILSKNKLRRRWLPCVTGFDRSDSENGYAGSFGKKVDRFQLF